MDADHGLTAWPFPPAPLPSRPRVWTRHALRRRRPQRLVRAAGRQIALLGLLLVLALALGIVGSAAAGYRTLVIRSGSMAPTLHVGELVLSRSVAPSQVRPGDLITFHDPTLQGSLVTHRVVSIRYDATAAHFQTRGDRNRGSESWSVERSARLGLVTWHAPYLGWWFLLLGSDPGRAGLVLLLAAWVLVESLRRVWIRR